MSSAESDHGTIKIPRDAFERHNERRKEMGQSWEEYIDEQAPSLSDLLSDATVPAEIDYRALQTRVEKGCRRVIEQELK